MSPGRTPAERGEAEGTPDSRMAGGGIRRQTKSRYDSISCSLAEMRCFCWIFWDFLFTPECFCKQTVAFCPLHLHQLLAPSVPGYIHPGSNSYSDIPCEIDDDLLALLQKEGIDDTLARHMAHLFTRDPLAARPG